MSDKSPPDSGAALDDSTNSGTGNENVLQDQTQTQTESEPRTPARKKRRQRKSKAQKPDELGTPLEDVATFIERQKPQPTILNEGYWAHGDIDKLARKAALETKREVFHSLREPWHLLRQQEKTIQEQLGVLEDEENARLANQLVTHYREAALLTAAELGFILDTVAKDGTEQDSNPNPDSQQQRLERELSIRRAAISHLASRSLPIPSSLETPTHLISLPRGRLTLSSGALETAKQEQARLRASQREYDSYAIRVASFAKRQGEIAGIKAYSERTGRLPPGQNQTQTGGNDRKVQHRETEVGTPPHSQETDRDQRLTPASSSFSDDDDIILLLPPPSLETTTSPPDLPSLQLLSEMKHAIIQDLHHHHHHHHTP